MTREEAKEIFLNRGYIDGVYDGNKWREACIVISKWLEQEPKTGHWIMTSDYLTTAYGSIDYVKCSCCGEDSLEEGDYCPNCGSKMIESQKVEDKEC